MYQHRQIHVWISESDYLLLQEQSVVTRESVSALLRRYIKNERLRLKQAESVPMSAAIVSPDESVEMLESFAS